MFHEFLKNTAHAQNVVVIKAPSTEAASKVDSVDMTFIDAGHGFDDVVADIRAWLPKTNRLICGHDYYHEDVKRAVADELGGVFVGPGSIWSKWIGAEAQRNAA